MSNGQVKEELIREISMGKLDELTSKIDSLESYLDKIYKCVNTHSQKEIGSTKDLPKDNLSKRAKTQNFKSFDFRLFNSDSMDNFGKETISVRDNMLHNIESAEKFIFNMDKDDFPNLLFYGNTGTGKTYLANCISNELINKDYRVRSYSAIELLDFINEALMIDRQNNLAEYKMLTECDLLVIDDLGTESITSFTNNRLFNILNTRMLSCKKTILCTNLNLNQIAESYTTRIFSRILESYKINKFMGEDLRWKALK